MPRDIGRLLIQEQGQTVRTVSLTEPVLKIGRMPSNGLVLDHELVSRTHAEIDREESGYTLTDLKSANGTLVNGQRLLSEQPQLLENGDRITIGPFELIYQASGQVAEISGEAPAPHAVPSLPALSPTLLEPPTPNLPAAPSEAATPLAPLALNPPTHDGPKPSVPLSAPHSEEPRIPRRGARSHYLDLLPVIFHDSDLLNNYLLIFESIWESLEQRQDYIDMYFDPGTCPEPFLAWLASWLGLSLNSHWPESRRRQLLAEATELYRWRGTRYGLKRMIEVCTGITPEITDVPAQGDAEPLRPCVFRVRMSISAEQGVTPELIEELIRAHKPAHALCILELRT